MVFDEAGTYQIEYTATDECGNTTNAERTVIVEAPPTYRTVLYTDGTLIINESDRDEAANVQAHGEATNVYPPLDADHAYVFNNYNSALWYNERASIKYVEIGSEIFPTSTKHWFNSCSNLETVDLDKLDTSNVTNMVSMFNSCSKLTSIDVSGFNTSNVTSMESMFYSCKMITGIDVSGFDTSNVTNYSQMFRGCKALTSLDVSNFNTSNATNMSYMFSGCEALTTLDLSGFDTKKVSTMAYMFDYCLSLTSLNINSFDLSELTQANGMFYDCHVLPVLDLSEWNTSHITNMGSMFQNCMLLQTIYASATFIVTQVTSSSSMFMSCSALIGGAGTTYNSSYTDKTRAKIDGGVGDEGYFTAKN